jgi:hypothetical protein
VYIHQVHSKIHFVLLIFTLHVVFVVSVLRTQVAFATILFSSLLFTNVNTKVKKK